MAGIEIPGIYRKCRLLIEYGQVAGWDALAAYFKVASGTVKGWGQGNAAQPRDRLPSRHLDPFVRLVANALPDETGPDRIQDIAFGPATLLEQALRARSPAALDRLLVDEADRERIRLMRKPEHSGLIELEGRAADGPILLIALDAFFRLECEAPFPVRHALALQQAHRLWGFVPAEIDSSRRRIMLPGLRDDGSPAFMRERTQAGAHRFIVFQTTTPAPILTEMPDRADIVLDYAALAGIVAFYRSQPEAGRHLYLLDLMIRPSR